MLALNDPVQITNIRSLAYGRKGQIINVLGHGKKTRKFTVLFTDLPELPPAQQRDQTGFTCVFEPDDIERVESEL